MCKLLQKAGHLEGEQLAITTVLKHVLTGDGPPPTTRRVSKWGEGFAKVIWEIFTAEMGMFLEFYGCEFNWQTIEIY